MTQREVELILVRQLASYLTTPIFVVDPKGTLIYFNEPAEELIDRRFEETEELTLEQWTADVQPTLEDGSPVPHEDRPTVVALEGHKPSHRRLWISPHGLPRIPVEVTALPIVGQAGRDLGAVILFWADS